MQRIMNNPDHIVDEMLQAYLEVNAHTVQPGDNPRVIRTAHPTPGKVGLVTGGGSGHKPVFLGYVGKNLCDAAAIGEVFSSPTAVTFLSAFQAANFGNGVACLYGNYSGDNMNVKMAVKMAAQQNITVKTVVATDDVASAPADQREKRRGAAGLIFIWKAAGACAALGGSLDEVIAIAQKANDNTRSIGIGLSSCILPSATRPNFEIADGTMEVGIGHHGEVGLEVCPTETAAQMAQRMVDLILKDQPYAPGEETAVLVSGLGATPLMEQYVLYGEVSRLLKERGISIYRSYVGNYFTSLSMEGITLTMMKLDDELKKLLDVPTYSVGLSQE